MTFHGFVKFNRYEEHTRKRGKYIQKYVLLFVQDIDTKRSHVLYDWSGSTFHAHYMSKYKDETLEVIGYINPAGKTNFTVLDRWGVWCESERRAKNPITEKWGYLQLVKKDK